jgi:glycosyltransferase involved in cell wall biosynthesis
LAESLAAIDVHLVSLRPELEGLIVPSKFYGIAAAGRPAIFIGDGDGEIARLLAHHGCGRAIAQGDGVGLAQVVLELAANPTLCQQMGARARQAFEREFDKPLAVARWERLLLDVAGSAPGPTHADSRPDSESGFSVRKAS